MAIEIRLLTAVQVGRDRHALRERIGGAPNGGDVDAGSKKLVRVSGEIGEISPDTA